MLSLADVKSFYKTYTLLKNEFILFYYNKYNFFFFLIINIKKRKKKKPLKALKKKITHNKESKRKYNIV